MSIQPFRPVKEAFRGIYKHGLMSFASVTILAACMIIIGSVLLIVANLNTFVDQLQDQNEIVVFVNDGVSVADTEKMGEELENMANIESVQFVSKEEALEEYKSMFESQADLFASLDEDNPLRDSYHVKVADLELYSKTMEDINALENIGNIRSSSKVVETLVNLRSTISMLGFWILVILLFVSLFIISNTVRLAMYSRRTEINIMKYVGATNGYIRRPFVFEGLIIGILACGIAYALQWYVYNEVIYQLVNQLALFEVIPFESVKLYVLGAFAVFSVLMGVLGSVLPMRKHLNV